MPPPNVPPPLGPEMQQQAEQQLKNTEARIQELIQQLAKGGTPEVINQANLRREDRTKHLNDLGLHAEGLLKSYIDLARQLGRPEAQISKRVKELSDLGRNAFVLGNIRILTGSTAPSSPGAQPAPGPQPAPAPGPQPGPNAPTNAPNVPHPNLDASLRPRFTALDPTEQALVNRVMTSLELAFTSVVANQENLISALQILNPTQLNSFAQEVNALGNSATRDQIQAAVGRIGLNDAQGRVLVIVAQYRRELLNAPAAGPQQAPVAPFSEDERKSLGAEARRLDGLTGQGSVLQRAMGRLQLAFKSVDLSKLPSVERAEGMGKFVSIIVAIVELLAALKNPTEDVAKKQAAEQANLSPEERNRKQGIDTLMREGAVEQPQGSGIYVVQDTNFGSSSQGEQLQFKFEGGQWQWRGGDRSWIQAGENPYRITGGTPPPTSLLSPAENSLRVKWNQVGAGLGKRNAAAQTEVKEAATKTTNEAQEKTNRENVQTELKHLNTLLKLYQTRRSSDGLPALGANLGSRIEEKTKEVTTLISGTSLTEAQRKSLPAAVTELRSLRQDLAKEFRKNVGTQVVRNPSSYGSGMSAGHIVAHGDGWKVDIDGVGQRGAIAFRFDTTSNQWQIKDARSVALWNSFTNVSDYSPTGPFTDSGRGQTESIVKKLREIESEAPIS